MKTNPLDTFTAYFIPLFIFATPLFFLPDFFSAQGGPALGWEFNKMYLVFGSSILILVLTLGRVFFEEKVSFYTTPLDLAVILFLLALVASSLLASTNRVLPFLGKTGAILSLTLFYFALVQARTKNIRPWLQALIASSFVLSWATIFAYLKIFPQNQNQTFTPTGHPLALVTFQVLVAPVIFIFAAKSRQILNKIVYFLAAGLVLVSLYLSIQLLLPGKPAAVTILPYKTSWWIAVEIFKNWPTAALGVGPENFVIAFSRFRPVLLNSFPFWQQRFFSSSSELLQILTTSGLIGLSALLFLFYRALKAGRQQIENNLSLSSLITLVIAFILLLAFPANWQSFFMIFVVLAIIAKQNAREVNLVNRPFFKTASGVSLLFLLMLAFFAARAYKSEVIFNKSLQAIAAGKGLEAYNTGKDAVIGNPFAEKYHLSFANINLGIANNLAAKKDLTDKERQLIPQLVSQAIAEAKFAISLNPDNPIYWENLAGIYRSLVNFASGADNWAIASLAQAIRVDPANPNLRLQLGGLFFSLGKYDEAIDLFRQAIDLKPDFANAYYNLAWAYQQKGDLKNAYLAMDRVLTLLPADSEDYKKAAQEAEELKTGLLDEAKLSTASAAKAQNQSLTLPPGLPSPPPAGPVQLPKEAGPSIPSEPTGTASGTVEPKL